MKRSLFIPILCCIFCNFVHSNRSNRPITPLTMNDIEEFVRGEMISLRQDIHADREKQGYLMRKLISYMAGLQIRDEHGMENQNSMLEILSDIMENQHLSMIEQAGLATQLQYIINQTIDKRNASEEPPCAPTPCGFFVDCLVWSSEGVVEEGSAQRSEQMLNFKKDKITRIQNALQNADVNQDKFLDFEELTLDLKALCYADGEIGTLFTKFDGDGNGVLDEGEQQTWNGALEDQKMSVVHTHIKGDSHFGKSAIDEVIENLESIPISRAAVEKCKQAIQDKLVVKWDEKVQVMEQRSIRPKMIRSYLRYMQNNYPGIDNTLREKLSGILFGLWRTYLDDFKQNHGSTEIAYGQVNFGKSSDRKRFACVYAFYSAEMVFAEEIVKKKSPFLWGLINLPTFEKEQADLPEGVAEAIHTYFQYKALTGYHKNGIISKINWIA